MSTFPPTCWQDIAAYDLSECVEGYMDYRKGDQPPGENHSPSFRWGWANAYADRYPGTDDFGSLRHQYARETGIGKFAARTVQTSE